MYFSAFFIFLVLCVEIVRPEGAINDPCITESTGSPGICKLLTDCQKVRDDVVKRHRLPQTCSFQGTQPIVCCPKPGGQKRQPGVISKIKCKKYSSYAKDSETAECGHKIVKRIVGGEVASRKEFPHMAILGYGSDENDIRWNCGGNIISEEYILTTAICVKGSPSVGEVRAVRVGITNLDDEDHVQKFKVSQRLVHPKYKSPEKYNNIGLIKLDKPIHFNSYARPACLYSNLETLPEKAIATGWGATEYLGGGSKDLLKVTLDVVNHGTCNATYSTGRTLKFGIVKESQMCAGSKNKDTCQGDSGGPLQIYHEGDDIPCMYDIVGLSSFGKACGVDPGVYEIVSHHIEWIEDIVWPQSAK